MIERFPAESADSGLHRWAGIAAQTRGWLRRRGLPPRDTVVLVPFAQLLPSARRAFAADADWLPRIETVQTLAASLGPAAPGQAGQVTFDATTDLLSAGQLLRAQAWGSAWARRDALGFERAVVTFVGTAHDLARAAFALPPRERTAHWAMARDLLAPLAGPGATERLLARVAVEWASLAPAPATDRLFEAPAPAAWIVVQAGGPDALTTRLVAERDVPCLWLDADGPEADPFVAQLALPAPSIAVCDGFEHEAQCASAQVLEHLRRGERPVALIAQDRLLMRRVRAVLEREHLRVTDETGWKLSTTRAAAQVMALLQAARHDATTDAVFDWLKSGTAWAQAEGGAAIGALETECRRADIARAAALDRAVSSPASARLWSAAAAVLQAFTAASRQPLQAWLDALATALAACGALPMLTGDDAGRQVIAALRLAPRGAVPTAWSTGANRVAMDFPAFRQWTDATLERATFIPATGFDEPADVFITPLARVMLRPFAAIVFPGADEAHLGAAPAHDTLLGDALAAQLGIATAAQRRTSELLAFAQALQAAPRVTLLRRRADGAKPLAVSPLLERLSLALARRGMPLPAWPDPRIDRPLAPTPIRMTAPSAPALVPARLSASACEALRACPYRFFALNMLGLREPDELEREVEKREYGTWLHAVLFEFHQARTLPAEHAIEVARLHALAETQRVKQGIADADFVPFAASFASLAPRYVAWLHERDADGARWLGGEEALGTRPPQLGGTELHGVIDRTDEVRIGNTIATQLIDYKTGGAGKLRERVREPFEDTQLAFYALLMRGQGGGPLTAAYLALDDKAHVDEIEHKHVEASAAALLDGLADDLGRLRAGAGLAALGEGDACKHCAARGICRRDDWSASDDLPDAPDARAGAPA